LLDDDIGYREGEEKERNGLIWVVVKEVLLPLLIHKKENKDHLGKLPRC
jgi:hypothetical protein